MLRLKRYMAFLIACGIFIVVIGNTLYASALDRIFLDEKYYPANFTTCIKEPGYTDWEKLGWLKLTELPTGGVHFEMVKSVQNVRYGVTRIIDTNGLHIVYDNYTKTEGSSGFFSVTLSVHSFNSDYLPDLNANAYGYLPFVLILDSVNGDLIARSSQSFSAASPEMAQTVLVSNNDNLKYDAIKDRPWDIKFKKVDENNYSVTINGVEAIIPIDVIIGKGSTLDLNACYAVFGTWANNNTMAYDLMSVHSGNEICADEISATDLAKATTVIDAIRKIDTIKADSDTTIKSARSGYTDLMTQNKGLVYNYNILVTSETVYPAVKAIADIGKVSLDSKEAIDKAVRLYSLLTTENRLLVSNWASMTSAQSELIRLKSLDGAYIKVQPTPVYEEIIEIDESSDVSSFEETNSENSISESSIVSETNSGKTSSNSVSDVIGHPAGNSYMSILLISFLGIFAGIGAVIFIIFIKSKNKPA